MARRDSEPLLSAAMIARDEADTLPDCLRSLDGIVDEVVLVDTGSRDDTPRIARDLGAHVLDHSWDGSFAAARNRALDVARGHWILYIDADERLRPTARSSVVELLREADEAAFRVLLRPLVGWTAYREYRLWRNDPRIRFDGVIHEKVYDAIMRVAAEDGRRIGDCNLELDHVGYEGDQTRKHHRNLPLLRAQLSGEPDNVFNWRHLGAVLTGLGRLEDAERALRRAVDVARAERAPSMHGGVAFVELATFLRSRGDDIGDLLAEAQTRYPENWMLVWLHALVACDAGRHEEALNDLDRLVAVDLESLPDQGVAYKAGIFGAYAHSLRGLCLLRLGRNAEAADAYRAAELLEPDVLEHRVKRMLGEARA